MIRLPATIAAVGLALAIGAPLAQAQTSMGGSPMPPPGGAPGMNQPGGMYGNDRMGSPMPGSMGMQGRAGMPADNRMEPPPQPFSNLNLPSQNVGDGAYNGGGVILEYLPDGTTRVVQTP